MPSSRLTTLAAALLLAARLGAQDTSATAPAKPPPKPPAPEAPAVQIDGLLQVWYFDGHTITTPHDSYRIRRADLRFSGVISPRVRWRVSLDGAKLLTLTKTTTTVNDTSVLKDVALDERTRILQEASINVAIVPSLRLDVGQQIIPLSLEGIIAASQIETIERAMFIAERNRGGGLGDVRDIGAAARGTVAAGNVDYQFGLFNEMGDSQNNTDQNDQKALIGRVAMRMPMLQNLQFGASGGFEGGPLPAQRRERAGGEALFRTLMLTVRGEVMGGRDGTVRRLGYYGLGAVRPVTSVEFVARYDVWDPDLHNESSPVNVAEHEIVGGVNYYIEGGATRLAANLIRSTFPSGKVSSSTQLLLALQVVW
jgi:hypothetical protein